jgi:hypothetical protein
LDKYIDKNVEAVTLKMKNRMEVGFKKYGTTTERTDLRFDDWANHLEEELMDSLVYIQALRNNNTIGNAISTLHQATTSDEEYAWSWHCNLAVPMQDEGMDWVASQKSASRIILNIFGVDMDKNKFFVEAMYRYSKGE